jgi:hypothetical protein
MARMARFKVSDDDAWYHIHSRMAGYRGDYSLSERLPRRRLIELIEHYVTAYFREVSSFCVMGTHYHIVARFTKPTQVTREELEQRAYFLYPSEASKRAIDLWPEEQRERFRQRLFDVSELMRNIQSAFARWYNQTYDRRGRFWGGRFKSVYLQDSDAVLDCMLYVDLNPVRAGIVERPEEWKGSSVYLREIGKGDWLLPLHQVCVEEDEESALVEYRARLYYRGNVPKRTGQEIVSDRIVEQEVERGFKVRGIYRKRLGYFVDGMVVGTEESIRSQLTMMREAGLYQRRKNPIAQLDGIHFTLREQRSTTIVF